MLRTIAAFLASWVTAPVLWIMASSLLTCTPMICFITAFVPLLCCGYRGLDGTIGCLLLYFEQDCVSLLPLELTIDNGVPVSQLWQSNQLVSICYGYYFIYTFRVILAYGAGLNGGPEKGYKIGGFGLHILIWSPLSDPSWNALDPGLGISRKFRSNPNYQTRSQRIFLGVES